MAGETRSRRSPAKPATAKDKALGIKHLKDSVRYNKSHASDHLKAAKEDQAKLATYRKKKLPRV
jgi:hypothetical protein